MERSQQAGHVRHLSCMQLTQVLFPVPAGVIPKLESGLKLEHLGCEPESKQKKQNKT